MGRRQFAQTGVTDGSGNVTFSFSPPFTSLPAVTVTLQSADTALTEARISSLSMSSVTINVRRSPAVTVLGIAVLQVPQNASGVTVHLAAQEPS